MKKILLLILLFTSLSFALEIDARVNKLEKRIKQLEEKFIKIESQKKLLTNSFLERMLDAGTESKKEKSKSNDSKTLLKLQASNLHIGETESIQYNNYKKSIYLSYELINKYSKGIKQLKGSLLVVDLLDETILHLTISPDIYLQKNNEKVISGNYEVQNNHRILLVKAEDTKLILKIEKIVFSDNSIINFNE